jgi:subtilase family serine protease
MKIHFAGRKTSNHLFVNPITLLILVGLFSISCASLAGRQQLHGHLPKDFEKAKIVRDVPETEQWDLTIGLPFRNRKILDKYLKDVQDPKSPQFRRTLSPK